MKAVSSGSLNSVQSSVGTMMEVEAVRKVNQRREMLSNSLKSSQK